MKKMKVVVVGCGDRACVYANEARGAGASIFRHWL